MPQFSWPNAAWPNVFPPHGLRLALALAASLALVGPGVADSLSDRRAAKAPAAAADIEVACGKLDKENCAIVVPEMNSKTVSANLRLKPLESRGSVESVSGLCDGDVKVAVVQMDVLVQRAAKPDCAGKVVGLGSPLYPYQGFMVVRQEAREDRFGDMVDAVKPGAVLRVAAAARARAARPRCARSSPRSPSGSR